MLVPTQMTNVSSPKLSDTTGPLNWIVSFPQWILGSAVCGDLQQELLNQRAISRFVLLSQHTAPFGGK